MTAVGRTAAASKLRLHTKTLKLSKARQRLKPTATTAQERDQSQFQLGGMHVGSKLRLTCTMSFAPLSPGRQDSPPDRLRTKTLARALRDRTQRLEPMRKAQVKALVLHLERCRSPSTPASGCWLAFKIFAAQARAPRSMAGVIDSTRLARPRSRVVQRPRREGEQAAAGRVLFELNSELAFAAQDRQAGRQTDRQTACIIDSRPAWFNSIRASTDKLCLQREGSPSLCIPLWT